MMRFRADGHADMRGLTCSVTGFANRISSSPVDLAPISDRVPAMLALAISSRHLVPALRLGSSPSQPCFRMVMSSIAVS